MEEHLHLPQFLLFLLSFCFSSLFFLASSHNISTDTETLLIFKSMYIKSDPQNSLLSWNSSLHVCNWTYISCNTKRTRVAVINLYRLGISGTIPPHLSNLSSLIYLNLSSNLFSGQIPPQLGQLSLLQDLHLTNNSLQGSIPANLSGCLNLRRLHLELNNLTGSIPSELGLLTQLKTFSIVRNGLTASIPPSFGNLTSLVYFYLNRNVLSGQIPAELGLLRNLLRLQFTDNQFSGEIPSSLFNISSLVLFSVASNRLVGELPVDIGANLPNLEQIYMADNMLLGHIPRSLSNISGIQSLDLRGNRFSGPLPLLGRMLNLVTVNLANNNFSSTTEEIVEVFNSLVNCSQLEILSLASNQLAGRLPSMIANLSIHLREFYVDNNLLSGTFPEGIERYLNLTVLALQKNQFAGFVSRTIGLLPNLQRFHLEDNFFSGELPDTFSNLTNLFQLTLSKNLFSGEIPKSIEACKLLVEVDLSWNMFNGSLPKEIFNLSGLTRHLNLAKNSLTGILPAEVSILKMLSFLDVSDNELSGEIPASIGECLSLQSLLMARNKFQGLIPESLGKLTVLEALDLSSNLLSGQIPTSLGGLKYLKMLNLSFNNLVGEVPMAGVFLNLGWEFLQGNNQLCGINDLVAIKKLRLPKCVARKVAFYLALKIAIPLAGCALLLCAALCLICIVRRRRKKRDVNKRGLSLSSFKGKHRSVSYGEILSATDGFDQKNFIGKGALGSVYRGVLGGANEDDVEQKHSIVVAIKVIDLQQSEASTAFDAECEFLRNIRQQNLVKVITSCSSIDQSGAEFKALVMEYLPNGSLDKWLHPETESMASLNLVQRLNIAIDVATALDYLHHDCDAPIAHGNLKPSNVLLDNEMSARVADFGLARLLSQKPAQKQSGTAELKGFVGYIAPEYGPGGEASTSGDVYSYGILLLEMFTGKKPTDDMFKDGLDLKKYAAAVYNNRTLEIVDPKLLESNDDLDSGGSMGGNPSGSSSSATTYSHTDNSTESDWKHRKEVCLEAIIRLGLSCAADAPAERGNMREALTKMVEIKETLLQTRRG